MSWVNLNDVYVNQTGGTIAGDLSVNGALTVNDGKGKNTTYNVANEITTLRDSVSQISKNPKIYVGTKVVNSWGGAGQLKVFSSTEFSTLFGGEFGFNDCVLVMNGDGIANGVYLSAAGYWSGDGIWVKTLNGSGSNGIRINYVVIRL